jgi:hypothetical protein
MGLAFPAIDKSLPVAVRFRLLARCHNCYKMEEGVLPVPEVDEAPRDRDELLDSNLLASMVFKCDHCEGLVSTVIGLDRIDDDVDTAQA